MFYCKNDLYSMIVRTDLKFICSTVDNELNYYNDLRKKYRSILLLNVEAIAFLIMPC